MRHRSNIFGLFGGSKAPKAPPVDPAPFYKRAAALSRQHPAKHFVVKAPAQNGRGEAWFWITGASSQSFGVQALERARSGSYPKRYWRAESPWKVVRDNLAAYRSPEREKFVYIDAYTGEAEGPLSLSEIQTRKNSPEDQKMLEVFTAIISDLQSEGEDGLLAWLYENNFWTERMIRAILRDEDTSDLMEFPDYRPMQRFDDLTLEGKRLQSFNAAVSKVLTTIKEKFEYAPFPSMDFYTPGAMGNKTLEKARVALFAIKPQRGSREQAKLLNLQDRFTFWFVAPSTLEQAHKRWKEWTSKYKDSGETPESEWYDTASNSLSSPRGRFEKPEFHEKIKKWVDEYTGRREKNVGEATVMYESALMQYLGGAEPHEDVDPTESDYHYFDEESYYDSTVLYEAHFVFWLMRVILKDLFSDKCVGADRLEKSGDLRDVLRSFDNIDYSGFIERLFVVADSINACGAGQTSFLFGFRR